MNKHVHIWSLGFLLLLRVSPAAGGGEKGFTDASLLPEKCGLRTVAAVIRDRMSMSPQGAVGAFSRTERQKVIRLGHFRVHYDTTGGDEAAVLDANHNRIPGSADRFADSVAVVANRVWALEAEALGYLAPPSDGMEGGGPEYDIYVRDLRQTYGSTFTETPLDNLPDGGRFTSYLEIDNDFIFVSPPANRGLPALRVTLAHEFHHAIQLGSYGFWLDHIYFYEMSSTWMEDVAFPEVNDYFQYLFSSESQFATPEIPFTDNSFIVYSRAVWGHFVAAKFGLEAMKRPWEMMIGQGIPPITAIDAAFREEPYNTTLAEAFADWTLWNYFTGIRAEPDYYPEGEAYPEIVETTVHYTSPADTVEDGLRSLASVYHLVRSSGAPLTLVTSNISWKSDPAGNDTSMAFSYLMNDEDQGGGYEPTLAGIFVKREVQDPFVWSSWAVVNGLASVLGGELPPVAGESVFPQPFVNDGNRVVNLPLDDSSPVTGDVLVFASDMSLVFSSEQQRSRSERGIQVMQWNGRTRSGELASSGIYLYVISLPDRPVITGKLAVIGK